jgi:predicted nucleic acid-binding protein
MDALHALALMRKGQQIDLFDAVAMGAARLSFSLKILLADSIILLSAHLNDAKLLTQDAHFENLEGVYVVRKV